VLQRARPRSPSPKRPLEEKEETETALGENSFSALNIEEEPPSVRKPPKKVRQEDQQETDKAAMDL
jgi:hypothetical protein